MRVAGLVLILMGFGWLAWDQFSFGPLARVAANRSANTGVLIRGSFGRVPLADLPDTGYSVRNDVVRVIARSGANELYDLLPNTVWPGTMMLLGGLLVFREIGRRKSVERRRSDTRS
jgi:hypothetical protein